MATNLKKKLQEEGRLKEARNLINKQARDYDSQENINEKVQTRANQLMAITEIDKSKMLDTNEFFYNYDKQKLKEENQKSLEGLNDGTLGGYMSMGLVSTLNKLKSLGQKPKDFYDGKDITDIPKVIGSTLLGIPTHIIGGIEGIGNTGTQAFGYGMSAINDIAGNKETAERWKRATQEQQKEHDEVKNKIYGLFDKNSLLGETSNEVAEGVGQSTALGVVGSKSKLAGNLLTFQQGFGNSLHDTYTKEDAEGWQALLRGVGSGAISTLTENLFQLQGFGGSSIDDAIRNNVTKQIESGIGKALARTAISAGGEGTEEVLEALGNTGLNYIMNRITEQVGHGAKFDENINVEELFENATVGFLNGLLGEGGSTYLQTNASSNATINQIEQDTNSKLTKEEKKAIKQETLLNSETQRENEYIIDKSNLTDSQKEHLKTFAQNNYLTNKDVQQAIEMATKHNEQFTTQDYDFNRNIEIDADNLNEVKNQNEDTLKNQIHSILEGETTITDLINNNEKITDEQKQELMDLTKDENNNLIDVLNQLNDYENTNNMSSNDTTMQNEALLNETQQTTLPENELSENKTPVNEVDINNEIYYNKDTYKPKQTKLQSITVAPYYNTKVTDENFEEVKNQVDEHYRNTVNSITSMFGGKIKNVNTNIGGFTYSEGQSVGQLVNELSYTFELENVDEKTSDIIASVIGDLAHEQQEAVIASNYEKINSKKANALETRIKFNNIEGVKEALDRAGIQDYTIDTNNNYVKILDFEGNMGEVIAQLTEELGGNYNGTEWTKCNSRYYDSKARRGLYQAWLEEADRNGETGELYNYITKAKQKVEERIKKNEEEEQKTKNSQNEGSFSVEEKTDEEVLREETNKLLNNELPKTKPRQFPISTQKSEYISEETKRENSRKILKTETGQYIPIGNQETIDKANSVIQTSGADKVYDSFNKKFENNEKMTLDDIAEAELLIQHYSDIGDNKKAIKLIEEVGILGTELGQQVQALSIIKKMTPQGQLAVAKKLADRLSQKYDTDITLSDEVQKEILNSDMENIEDAIDKAYTEIADQLPLTIKERLDNLRFLAMLGNPKTHIRNMVGNVGNRALTNIKNTVKGGIEDLVGMAWKDYQKNATLGIATKDQRTFAKLDAEKLGEAIDNIGNKYSDKPESIISKKKRHFDNKILNGLSKFNTEQLNKEDTKALKGAYRDALQNYMLANNLSSEDLTVLESDSREVVKQKEEALRKAREYASQQAKEATFHQANEVATWLNNLKDSKSLPRKNCRAFSRRYSTI